MKLRKGNVFSHMCVSISLSVHGEAPTYRAPVRPKSHCTDPGPQSLSVQDPLNMFKRVQLETSLYRDPLSDMSKLFITKHVWLVNGRLASYWRFFLLVMCVNSIKILTASCTLIVLTSLSHLSSFHVNRPYGWLWEPSEAVALTDLRTEIRSKA